MSDNDNYKLNNEPLITLKRKVAHTVGAPLALVDVALPAAVWVLLKHLWQMGRGAWSLPAPSGQPAAMVQLLPSPQGAPPDAQVGL